MVNEEILNYLRENKDKFSLEDLKNELLKGGWNEDEINEAIAALESEKPQTTEEPAEKEAPQPVEEVKVETTEATPEVQPEIAEPAKEAIKEQLEMATPIEPSQEEKPAEVVETPAPTEPEVASPAIEVTEKAPLEQPLEQPAEPTTERPVEKEGSPPMADQPVSTGESEAGPQAEKPAESGGFFQKIKDFFGFK